MLYTSQEQHKLAQASSCSWSDSLILCSITLLWLALQLKALSKAFAYVAPA